MLRLTLAGRPRLAALLTLGVLTASACAQTTLTKLFDFGGTIGGATDPYSAPVLIGNELWFTTNAGGENDFGTISKFNLGTNTLTSVFSMDTTGNSPFSTLTQVGDQLFYTTSRGGTGDRGTISVWNTTTSTNTVLFNSPQLGNAQNLPYTFHGGVTYLDNGDGTADLYALHQSGGSSASGGGVIKLTLDLTTMNATSTLLASFPTDATHGRQPFEGFTKVGDKLYFTTQVGGPTLTGVYPNGAGAIGVVDTTTDSVNSAYAFINGGDGSTALPQNDLTYDAANNVMYFTTNGTASQPGALLKLSLTDGSITTLYELTGGSASGPFPDGRFATSSIALVENKLFFTTIQGGSVNGGTINMFDLTTNTFVKLYDLDSATADNPGGEARGGFLPVQNQITGEWDLYLLTKQGGKFDQGTVLKLHVIPEPHTATLGLLGLGLLATNSRRRPQA